MMMSEHAETWLATVGAVVVYPRPTPPREYDPELDEYTAMRRRAEDAARKHRTKQEPNDASR